jgi:hypothetical protein
MFVHIINSSSITKIAHTAIIMQENRINPYDNRGKQADLWAGSISFAYES